MISPGSGSNGMVASADTHVPKTAAEFAATDKAGLIAPSDVRGGRASCEVQSGEARKVLSAFYKTVDVMKSARNSPTHWMCVWADDMKAVEDVMLFLETLRDAPPPAPDVLMNVINAKINDYVELHNRGDLTEHGDHAWLAIVNLRRDMEFALASAPQEGTSSGGSWTPEQYWEYVSGLAGDFEADQMRDMLAKRGLTIVASPIPSANCQCQPLTRYADAPHDPECPLSFTHQGGET